MTRNDALSADHPHLAVRHSRRNVLGAVAALSAGSALPTPGAVAAQPADLMVRRDVYGLRPDGPEIASLRRGVARMKRISERDASDPRGWVFQANIHGAPVGDGTNPAWNQCQHRNHFFLPWHRMYLFWFERILRWAAEDPALTLPYWDYSIPVRRAIPPAFRQGGGRRPDPLFVAERAEGLNAGAIPAFPDHYFEHRQAFTALDFGQNPDGNGFGGAALGGAPGALETTPHSWVHGIVGGRFRGPNGTLLDGLMGRFDTAARDPLFWLHHANIDRLWERWLELGGGRANPTGDREWMTRPFAFFDEDASAVWMTPADVLDSAAQLKYRYDGTPEACCGGPGGSIDAPGRALGELPRRQVASSVGGPIVLGPDSLTVPIAVDAPAVPAGAVGARQGFVLVLEGIRAAGASGVAYEVHLGGGTAGTPSPADPSFVGPLSLFGLQPTDGDHADHLADSANQTFDATTAVERLRSAPDWPAGLTATFVPRVLSEGVPAPPGPWVRIERVSLTFG